MYLGSGDPHIYNEWWDRNSFAFIMPWFSSQIRDYKEGRLTKLEDLVKTFRSNVIGAKTMDPRYIVFGSGSTQVIHAILLTLVQREGSLTVYMEPPYYMLMKQLIEATPKLRFTCEPKDADLEIIVSPNNPTGEQRSKPLSKARYVIYDHAYDWPVFTEHPTDDSCEAISVFTASKLFGVGGFRVGWALFADNELGKQVDAMLALMGICPNSYGLSALEAILNMMVYNEAMMKDFFRHHREILLRRRRTLEALPGIEMHNTDGPYAWMTLKHEDNGVTLRPGSDFGASDSLGRFSLITDDETFKRAVKLLRRK